MGMLRPIARNFFTLIFVVDPADPVSKTLMSVGHSLFVHKVPIRIGFVFVVDQDKSATGMNDPGIALLNLYNFAKSDRNSPVKALDLVVKVCLIFYSCLNFKFRLLKVLAESSPLRRSMLSSKRSSPTSASQASN